MREAHPIEREIGIDWYASEADGTDGRLKVEAEDFRVRERETIDPEPVDAAPDAYPYLVIRATLTGWDTFDFADRLGGALGISRHRIEWAGTKDKHAVTTQLFSIEGVSHEDFPDIANAEIEAIGRFGRALHYGDLAGNVFRVRVRDPERPGQVEAITDELEEFGGGALAVPNYFGHQRFGSMRPITHLVGLAIIRGDWEGAVMAYLGSPSEREPVETREARAYIEDTRDWAVARDRLPDHLGHEHRLLEVLDGNEGDDRFRHALAALPEGLRRLFVHAAQGYLFNRIVSLRMDRGIPLTESIPGDVVCFGTNEPELGTVPDHDRTQRVTEDRVETINRHLRNGRAFVTAPLVGTETNLDAFRADGIVREILQEEGLTAEDFALPDPYGSSGTVRALLVRPDLEITSDPLEFRFDLPSGAYATVVLREYLKVDPDAMA